MTVLAPVTRMPEVVVDRKFPGLTVVIDIWWIPLDKPDQPRAIPEPGAILLTVSASSVTAG